MNLISFHRFNLALRKLIPRSHPLQGAYILKLKIETMSGSNSKSNELGLPYFTKGEVVKGFGRGSKDLGIPTANFTLDVVDRLPEEVKPGVYFGFANLDDGPVYKMVMSVGWNPFYQNTKKSMETHIMHQFDEDFYGKILKVAILEYIRPEKNFKSLDDLITAINEDIRTAEEKLDTEQFSHYKLHDYFKTN